MHGIGIGRRKTSVVAMILAAVLAAHCGGGGDGGDDVAVTVENPRDGAGGFLWKPRGEHSGNLVVLLPTRFNGQIDRVEVHRQSPPSDETAIERGVFSGVANGNRSHFRFARPGAAFGNGIFAVVFVKDGTIAAYPIDNGSLRID